MPRRNAYLLGFLILVSLLCYRKADSRFAPMFDTFSEIVQQIETHYVEPIDDDRELFESALHGMLDRLDPYSAYLPPREADSSRESLDQEFGGIGVEVSIDRDTQLPTVSTPLVGTPAFLGGVLPGDRIVSINGRSTEGISMQDCSQMLRGKPGTPVTISVIHPGSEEPVDILLHRAIIEVHSVQGDVYRADGEWDFRLFGHEDIGYVRIGLFGSKTAEELRAALAQLESRGVRGVILDLRNNSGGLLEAAVEVCDLFVNSGDILTTRGRNGRLFESYQAAGKAPYPNLPLVVLVNQYSASAAEVVSGCLQDHGRAIVVGERSYGKGTVQRVIPLEGGRSELRLTIATFWRPSGRNIHRGRDAKPEDEWGVQPNEGQEIPMSNDEILAWIQQRRARDVVRFGQGSTEKLSADRADPQLARAIEILSGTP